MLGRHSPLGRWIELWFGLGYSHGQKLFSFLGRVCKNKQLSFPQLLLIWKQNPPLFLPCKENPQIRSSGKPGQRLNKACCAWLNRAWFNVLDWTRINVKQWTRFNRSDWTRLNVRHWTRFNVPDLSGLLLVISPPGGIKQPSNRIFFIHPWLHFDSCGEYVNVPELFIAHPLYYRLRCIKPGLRLEFSTLNAWVLYPRKKLFSYIVLRWSSAMLI